MRTLPTPISSTHTLSTNFRLNIYYLILEKMKNFADDAKYDITNVHGSQIQSDYEARRADAWERIENLNIIKRIISVCMYKP